MHSISQESAALRSIEASLTRANNDIPALKALFAAFGPLLAERARLRVDAPGWRGPKLAIDAERFSQGAFVLAQTEFGGGFEDMSEHLPAAAQKLLPIMAQSFPAIAAEVNALGAALASGALAPQALVAAGFGEPLEVPGVSQQTLLFAAAELVRPFLERQAQDLAALVQELPWHHANCPVCGGAPNMSMLRRVQEDGEFIQAHGGRRFLRCSCCATEWTHNRVCLARGAVARNRMNCWCCAPRTGRRNAPMSACAAKPLSFAWIRAKWWTSLTRMWPPWPCCPWK